MPLFWYLRPRLVALAPTAPVMEGARAIENNNIGAVVIQDRGRIVGIVTDRDLAVRVVGQGRDPKATTLGEIMTRDPIVLSPEDARADAIRLMVTRQIRRIPLVEGERLVGLVTLDDLLLDEAAPVEQLAQVVEAQVGAGGPTPPERLPGRPRGGSRAEATYTRFLGEVRAAAKLDGLEQAETALEVVLSSLVRRLTPDEAKDLLSQLPSMLHVLLALLPPGPDKLVTRETIVSDLVHRLDVAPARAAEILSAIGATITRNVSEGQMNDVRGQLPAGLREVFTRPAPRPAP